MVDAKDKKSASLGGLVDLEVGKDFTEAYQTLEKGSKALFWTALSVLIGGNVAQGVTNYKSAKHLATVEKVLELYAKENNTTVEALIAKYGEPAEKAVTQKDIQHEFLEALGFKKKPKLALKEQVKTNV